MDINTSNIWGVVLFIVAAFVTLFLINRFNNIIPAFPENNEKIDGTTLKERENILENALHTKVLTDDDITPQVLSSKEIIYEITDIELLPPSMLEKNPNENILKLKDNECSICFGDFVAGDTAAYSGNEQCKHVYHKDCIMQWLMLGHNTCPTCRNDFVELDINDVSIVKPIAFW